MSEHLVCLCCKKRKKNQRQLGKLSRQFPIGCCVPFSQAAAHTDHRGTQGSRFPLHFLSSELTISSFRQNKTQRWIQKISTLYNAEAPNNLETHEYPGLPNTPVILHKAIWLVPPFPSQNTTSFPDHLQSPNLRHCLERKTL